MTDKVLTRRMIKKEIKRLRKILYQDPTLSVGFYWKDGARWALNLLVAYLDKFK